MARLFSPHQPSCSDCELNSTRGFSLSELHKIGRVNDFQFASSQELVVAGQIVALFRDSQGDFHALDGVCPHQGGPLGEGRLEGCIVTCPWHGWQFDVRDGQHQINKTMRQPGFRVVVEDEYVYVVVESTQ